MSESFLTAFLRSHELLMLYHFLYVRSETHYLIVVVNERKDSFKFKLRENTLDKMCPL